MKLLQRRIHSYETNQFKASRFPKKKPYSPLGDPGDLRGFVFRNRRDRRRIRGVSARRPNDRQSSLTINQDASSQHGSGSIEAVDVSNVVDVCRPTVVEITTETATSGNNPFAQYVEQGAGSGVIMSADGYIITNNHVIANTSSIKVKTVEGAEYDAKLIGTDPQTDLAVIKIDADQLPAATFGNSNDLKVGDIAIAIGNPLGSLGGTVTTGIISALDREITIENETMTLLQTDAAINPGNSGGGCLMPPATSSAS